MYIPGPPRHFLQVNQLRQPQSTSDGFALGLDHAKYSSFQNRRSGSPDQDNSGEPRLTRKSETATSSIKFRGHFVSVELAGSTQSEAPFFYVRNPRLVLAAGPGTITKRNLDIRKASVNYSPNMFASIRDKVQKVWTNLS